MTTETALTNLAQQLNTTPGITRVAAGIVAIPAIMITPWLLFCEHTLTDCLSIANLVSVGMTLKTGEPRWLTPALGITGAVIGYNIYRAITDTKKPKNKKPTRTALQVETYVQPH